MADTGNEHELTYEFVARLHERTGGPKVEIVRADFTRALAVHRETIATKWRAEGVPEETVCRALAMNHPTGNPYLDLCILKSRFPASRSQFCTEELKTIPITEQIVLPMLKQGPVLQWLGIRAEESRRRAGQPRYNRIECGAMVWRPIFRWTVEDVWAIHRKHGLARNPLYDMGMNRVGCMPCINCRKSELRAISKNAPQHIDRIAAWETLVAMASKRGQSTFFAASTDPTDAPGEYADIRKVVDWAQTDRGGRQYKIFEDQQPGGGCDSDLGLCEVDHAA